MLSLVFLPDNLLLKICRYVGSGSEYNYKALSGIRLTCRSFNRICRELLDSGFEMIQTSFQLWLASQVGNPTDERRFQFTEDDITDQNLDEVEGWINQERIVVTQRYLMMTISMLPIFDLPHDFLVFFQAGFCSPHGLLVDTLQLTFDLIQLTWSDPSGDEFDLWKRIALDFKEYYYRVLNDDYRHMFGLAPRSYFVAPPIKRNVQHFLRMRALELAVRFDWSSGKA